PFAAYIALGAADAVKAVLPTALAFFNADPLAGGLYAVFEAAADDAQLAPGETLDFACFCADAAGDAPVNRAAFDPVQKKAGERLSVTGTLFLSPQNDGVCLTGGGENPLVRALLGIDPLDLNGFTLCAGTNSHPNAVMRRGGGFLFPPAACAAALSAGALTLTGETPQPQYESVVLYHGRPVLRSRFLESGNAPVRTVLLSAVGHGVLGADAIGGLNVTRGSQPVTNYTVYPLLKGLTEDAPVLYPAALPKNCRLLPEPGGGFAALIGDHDLTIVTVLGGAFSVRHRQNVRAALAALTTDGALFFLDGGGAGHALLPDGGGYASAALPLLDNAEQLAAVRSGAGYLLGVVRAGVFQAYLYGGGTAVKLGAEAAAPADFCLFAHDAVYLCAFSASAGYAAAFNASGEFSALKQRLSAFFVTGGFVPEVMGYGGLCVVGDETGRYAADFETGAIVEAADKTVCLIRDAALFFGAGPVGVFASGKTGGGLTALEADFSAADAYAAATLGDYVLILRRDGGAALVYAVREGRGLYCPGLSGGAVSATAVLRKNPMAGYLFTRATFTVALNGDAG
ncbi:MAG: hypothetical protein LBH24_04550, partial [Clostridiales bacterium]|nr:hypothetical protein [Clostridiales bacterium]